MPTELPFEDSTPLLGNPAALRERMDRDGFFYFRHFLPKIGNLVSKHKDAYTYLNQTVEDFPHGNNFLTLMENAGFKNLTMHSLTFGIAMLYIGDKIGDKKTATLASET